MDKLKPCPECGGEFVTLQKKLGKYRYECDDCCWTTAYHWYLTEEEAADAWNSLERKKQTEAMDELKPCPFCGGYAHLDKAYSYFRDIVIYCEECDTVFTLDDCDATEEDIVNAWNKRERKQGKWEKVYYGNRPNRCSECRKKSNSRTNFCPNCGADMR